MKVYGYVRVSTREQAEGGESLTTQQRTIQGYAMMKGWEVEAIFVEGGISGSIPLVERPEGTRLLGVVRRGDVVITPKLDRMFRSANDALATLQSMKDDGVALHMIDLGGDVTTNGVSKLVFTILAAVAEAERDRIREKIRDVKQDMAARGLYNGGKVPFGHDVVGGQLVPIPAEQKDLAEMKAMRSQGESFAAIGKRFGKPAMSIKRILDRTTD